MTKVTILSNYQPQGKSRLFYLMAKIEGKTCQNAENKQTFDFGKN